MTSGFLADLDAAVEQRCACLCGRAITDASPSAYFASEDCAADWHYQRRAVRPACVDGAALAALRRRLWAPIAETFREVVAALQAALRRVIEQLRPLFPRNTEPPTDLQQRALWLRRQRNTGPALRRRAPRKVAPPPGFGTASRARQLCLPPPVPFR